MIEGATGGFGVGSTSPSGSGGGGVPAASFRVCSSVTMRAVTGLRSRQWLVSKAVNESVQLARHEASRPVCSAAMRDRLVLSVTNPARSTVLATCLEVADSGPKRNKGLLGRDGLAPGEGLWIVPCESVHTFFMRFPIDLVYLDRKNTIKKVRRCGPMAAFGLPFSTFRPRASCRNHPQHADPKGRRPGILSSGVNLHQRQRRANLTQ